MVGAFTTTSAGNNSDGVLNPYRTLISRSPASASAAMSVSLSPTMKARDRLALSILRMALRISALGGVQVASKDTVEVSDDSEMPGHFPGDVFPFCGSDI